ncbi:hypothetical protein Tco_1500672 [Tanacetum coccineum]
MDQELTESTNNIPPSVVQPSPNSTKLPPTSNSSPKILEPNPHQPPIPYPSRLNKEKLQGKDDIQIHSFLQMFKKIHFNISFSEALAHMPKFAKMVKDLLTNKEKLLEIANTPIKSSIEDPSDLVLKDLPSHLEYAFFEGTSKLPVIIAKDLKKEEKEQLLKVLKSHKRAIAWKIYDIRGINPNFCTHKILMEDDFKPVVQQQRRVNPKIHEVIKAEVIKLLDAGLIYPISDSPWVSPIHVVPKKGGITVVTNENNELILTRLVTGWRVCIDYRKLNDTTRKDYFPLPFMDQMLE